MVDNDSLYKRPACLVGFNIKRTYICPLVPTYTYIPKHFAATIYLPLPKFYVLSSVLLCTVVKVPSHSHVQILDGKMCNRRCCCCDNVYGCVCTYIHTLSAHAAKCSTRHRQKPVHHQHQHRQQQQRQRQQHEQHQQEQLLHAQDEGGKGEGEDELHGLGLRGGVGVNARISLNRCRPIHVGHSPYNVSVPDRRRFRCALALRLSRTRKVLERRVLP